MLNIANDPNDVATLFGKDEQAWLDGELKAFWEACSQDFDYTDNFRFCVVDDPIGESLYDDRSAEGCCGSHEEKFGPSPQGRCYRYGFNHGH